MKERYGDENEKVFCLLAVLLITFQLTGCGGRSKVIVTNDNNDKMTLEPKNGKLYAKVKCHKASIGTKLFVFKKR